MTQTEFGDVYSATQQVLRENGLEDDFFRALIASRLLVERVGETRNLGWWDSRVLSETGRTRLEEVTPKTTLKAQIDLATKVGRKVESDRLPDDAISLFNFGPHLESQLTAALEELTIDSDSEFGSLQNLTIQSFDLDWTAPILDQITSNQSVKLESDDVPNESDGTIALAEQGWTQDQVRSERWSVLARLLHAYGKNTQSIQIPYFPLKVANPEIER